VRIESRRADALVDSRPPTDRERRVDYALDQRVEQFVLECWLVVELQQFDVLEQLVVVHEFQ
jgi:hypothetical protein